MSPLFMKTSPLALFCPLFFLTFRHSTRATLNPAFSVFRSQLFLLILTRSPQLVPMVEPTQRCLLLRTVSVFFLQADKPDFECFSYPPLLFSISLDPAGQSIRLTCGNAKVLDFPYSLIFPNFVFSALQDAVHILPSRISLLIFFL